jgi:hypothetical protein
VTNIEKLEELKSLIYSLYAIEKFEPNKKISKFKFVAPHGYGRQPTFHEER